MDGLVRSKGWWCAFERVGADAKPTERSLKGKGVGGFRGIVRKISLILRMGSNPSGSRPNSFGRQHLTFDKGRAWMPEVERPEFRKDAKPTERSYGKNVVQGEGIVRM